MCGIIAYYKIETPEIPKYLTHRGPDEQVVGLLIDFYVFMLNFYICMHGGIF